MQYSDFGIYGLSMELLHLEDIQKPIFELQGLLLGICADSVILDEEVLELQKWLELHKNLSRVPIVKKIQELVEQIIQNREISENYKQELLEVCKKPLIPFADMNTITASLKELYGILNGISSDGIISLEEFQYLNEWASRHSHLSGRWPYDDVLEFITSFQDRKDPEIAKEFLEFCSIFKPK